MQSLTFERIAERTFTTKTIASNLVRAGQFAQVARQGALILVALALPRLGVGRELIGQWESLLYVGYVLGFGWLTGLLQAYLVTVNKRQAQDRNGYANTILVGTVGFSALLLLVAALLHAPLFRLLQLGESPPAWWLFFIFLLTQWPGLFFEQILLAREKPLPLVLFSGASALGLTLALLLPFYLRHSLTEALQALALVAALKGVFIAAWSWRDNRQTITPKQVTAAGVAPIKNQESRILTVAWPLIAYASVGALVTAFDPWFVNYWYEGDEATFAVFRYGARELPLLGALTSGVIVAVLPSLSEDLEGGLRLLKDSSRRLYHWVFGGATFLLLTSDWWWTVVFTELFADSLPLFRVYVFVIVSRLLFPVPVLTALGHTRWLVGFGGLELLVNIILSLLLAPAFGLVGIIWATVIAYLIDKVCLMVYLWWKAGIGPERYTDWEAYLTYVLGLGVVFWWIS